MVPLWIIFSLLLNALAAPCGLTCWLNSLTIAIPDQTFSQDYVTFKISGFVCTHIALGGIKADLLPPAGSGLSAQLSGIGVQCWGNWAYSLPILPSGSGTVNATVSKSQLSMAMLLKAGTDGLVDSAKITKCDSQIVISDIEFHGGAVAWILELFKPLVADYAQQELNAVACQQLTSIVDVNLTNFLHELNDDIRPYIHPKPPPPPPHVPDGMVILINNTVVDLIDYLLDSIIGTDGPLGINRIVNQLTNDTGSWDGNFTDFHYQINLAAGNVTFGLDRLVLGGLNSWSIFDVLRPVSNYSLGSATAMGKLDIQAYFFVNASLGGETVQSANLFERGNISISLSEAQLNTTFQLALNETTITRYAAFPLKFTQLGCWLDTLYNFNATQAHFNMTAQSIIIQAVGGDIEEEFDKAISTVLELFTTAYAEIIPAFFNGIVAGPLRKAGNEWISNITAQHAANATCPHKVYPITTVVPEMGMIDLTKNSLMEAIDFGLNDVIGANGPLGINTIVNSISNNTGVVDIDLGLNYDLPVSFLGNISFGISTLILDGINTFSTIDLLEPIGPQLLKMGLDLQNFKFSFMAYIEVARSGSLFPLKEEMNVSVSLKDLRFNGWVQVALDEAHVNHLLAFPGELVQLACLAPAIFDLNFTNATCDFHSLEIALNPQKVQPFREVPSNIVSLIANGLVGSAARVYVNNWLTSLIKTPENPEPCVDSEPPTPIIPPGMVDFENNPFIKLTDYLANDVVGADGPLGLNKIIDSFTKNGALLYPLSTVISYNSPWANLDVGLINATISGLDTFRNLSLLRATQKQRFDSTVAIKTLNISLTYYLNLTFGAKMPIYRTGNVTLDLSKIDLNVSLDALINSSALEIYLASPLQLLELGCALDVVFDAFMTELSLQTDLDLFSLFVQQTGKNFGSSLNHLVSTVVKGASQGPLRAYLNQFIHEKLKSFGSCLPPTLPDAPDIPLGSMNLEESKLIELVNYLSDDLIGVGGLNELINLLTSNGTFKIPLTLRLPNLKLPIADIQIEVNGVDLAGINTWTEFDPLRTDGNFTLNSTLQVKKLDLNVSYSILIQMKNSTNVTVTKGHAILFFNGLGFKTCGQVALNQTSADILSRQPYMWEMPQCALNPFYNLVILDAEFDASIERMELFIDKNNFDFSDYHVGLHHFLKSIVAGPGIFYANEYLSRSISESHTEVGAVCFRNTPAQTVKPLGIVPLSSNSVVMLLDYILDDVVGTSGPLNVNFMLAQLTNHTGVFQFSDLKKMGLFNSSEFVVSVPSFGGNLTLAISNFSFGGLTTWSVFDLLRPLRTNFTLDSATQINVVDVNLSYAFTSTVPQLSQYHKNSTVGVSLETNSVGASMIVALNQSAARHVSTSFYTVLDPSCIVDAVQTFAMDKILVNTSVKELRYNTINTTNLRQLLNVVNTTYYAPTIATIIFQLISGPVRSYVNELLASKLENFNHTCAPLTPDPPPAMDFLASVVAGSGFAILVTATIVAGIVVRKKKQRAESPIPVPTAENSAIVDNPSYPDGAEERASLLNLNSPNLEEFASTTTTASEAVVSPPGSIKYTKESTGDSLAWHPSIHWTVAYGLPIVLLSNIVIFVLSNTSAGASVEARFSIDGTVIWAPALFSFTLANSVRDMWHAGVYPLSLLIAVLSGAWPYLKIILMLLCWFIPERTFPYRQRERCLMVLDALGKWSLIDAYVLTMMLVGFRFHLAPPASTGSNTAMDIFVIPGWGIYLFLLATVISLVSTHVLLHFHRASSTFHKPSVDAYPSGIQETKKPSVSKKYFKDKWGGKCSTIGPILISALLLFTMGQIIAGSILDSFTFEFGGLAGEVVNFLNPNTTTPANTTAYSLISVGLSIPTSVPDPNSIPIRIIQLTFYIFAFAMPLLHLSVLLVLWLAPLTATQQSRIFIVSEVCNAWSSLDVFVVSILASLLEIDQFALFIIGDRCDLINTILKEYFPGFVGSPQCFALVPRLLPGCWMLFGACIVYICVGLLVMRVVHVGLRKRKEKREKSNSAYYVVPETMIQ